MVSSSLVRLFNFNLTSSAKHSLDVRDGNSNDLLYQYEHTGLFTSRFILTKKATGTAMEGSSSIVDHAPIFQFNPIAVTAKELASKTKIHFLPLVVKNYRTFAYNVEYNGRVLRWEVNADDHTVSCISRDFSEEVVRCVSKKGWTDGTIWFDLTPILSEKWSAEQSANLEEFLLITTLSMPQVIKASEGVGRTMW